MSFLAHYECDNQDDVDTTLHDVSGHANNHDIPIAIGAYSGFRHNRFETIGNSLPTADAANGADFVLTGEVTIMAWVQMFGMIGVGTDSIQILIAHGDYGETQAENYLWSLCLENDFSFSMRWEYGVGVDVLAKSPAAALDIDGDGYGGQSHFNHIAVIRTVNGANREVKFVRNGVDLAADVTGLTAPDGGSYPNAGCRVFQNPRDSSFGRLYGAAADIRVYDHALSVSDVLNVYNAEKVIHLNSSRSGIEVFSPLTSLASHGEAGSIYDAAHTGSMLDPDERPNSGWASVRP